MRRIDFDEIYFDKLVFKLKISWT